MPFRAATLEEKEKKKRCFKLQLDLSQKQLYVTVWSYFKKKI